MRLTSEREEEIRLWERRAWVESISLVNPDETFWEGGIVRDLLAEVDALRKLGDRLLFCLDHCYAPSTYAAAPVSWVGAVTLEDVQRAKREWLDGRG